jgi:hypothetical protein
LGTGDTGYIAVNNPNLFDVFNEMGVRWLAELIDSHVGDSAYRDHGK